MLDLPKLKKFGSARDQIDIEAIRDGIIVLPHNRYISVVRVAPINLELKSEADQDALIDLYESFLNGLPVPIQICIRTRVLRSEEFALRRSDALRLSESYLELVAELLDEAKVITRTFYLVISYAGDSRQGFDIARGQLLQQTRLVQKGLQNMGIQTNELTNADLFELFYSFYNEELSERQPLSAMQLEEAI